MNLRHGTCNMRRSERGFTLIEVLLAIALFAIGMLALAGMFAGQMVGHAMGRNMTEATTLAQDLLEQLYNASTVDLDSLAEGTAPVRFGGGDYGGGAGGVFIDVNKNQAFTAGVDTEYSQYQRVITRLQPNVPASGFRMITVTVRWRDDIGAEHSVVATGVVEG